MIYNSFNFIVLFPPLLLYYVVELGYTDGDKFLYIQALGYLFDVYYRRIQAEKDFLTYALFISFFPSIVAGPINKALLVILQLKAIRLKK